MKLVRPYFWLRKWYGNVVWRLPTSEKKIYLTFDDGPTSDVTDWVLGQLKNYNAKATFFCVGNNVQNHPSIYKSVIENGHMVGNHTYSHINGWKTKDDIYIEDIRKCATLVNSNLFRPPYGKIKRSQLKKIKYQVPNLKSQTIMWDVLSYDFDASVTPEQCFKNVTKHAREGSIVVFHDSAKAFNTLKEVLPRVLKFYSDRGFLFEKIQLS